MPKKSRSAAQANPAIRLSNLHPRLSRLFGEAPSDPATLRGELNQLTDGLKPASFLPILVSAFVAAAADRRAQLDAPLGDWLHERGLLASLGELEARQVFEGPAREAVRAWMTAGGVMPAALVEVDPAELFIAAYEIDAPSQASTTLFWYEDGRRRRVCVAGFLIDFEPPWEGALKDIAYRTFREYDQAYGYYTAIWQNHGQVSRLLDVATAMAHVWSALRQSQAQDIRLPADFIAVMPKVLPVLLALPTSADTSALSAAEVEAMAASGRIPEDLRREEQVLGYQTRMDDGRIIRIIRPPDDY